MIRSPFQPLRGGNKVVTPAAASASTTIDAASQSVRFVNSGANICYVRIGTAVSGTPATTADTPVLPNSELILCKAEGENTVAYISATGTTLNIQTGEGGV